MALVLATEEFAASDFTGQIWAAAITALAGLVVVLLRAHSGTLRKSERLTELAANMRPSTERTLVEDLRDDYLTSWVLKQMAPAYGVHRTAAVVLYGIGAFFLFVWVLFAIIFVGELWTWWFYVAGLVPIGIGVNVEAVRVNKRKAWTREERANRWMRMPMHHRLNEAIAAPPARKR